MCPSGVTLQRSDAEIERVEEKRREEKVRNLCKIVEQNRIEVKRRE